MMRGLAPTLRGVDLGMWQVVAWVENCPNSEKELNGASSSSTLTFLILKGSFSSS